MKHPPVFQAGVFVCTGGLSLAARYSIFPVKYPYKTKNLPTQ